MTAPRAGLRQQDARPVGLTPDVRSPFASLFLRLISGPGAGPQGLGIGIDRGPCSSPEEDQPLSGAAGAGGQTRGLSGEEKAQVRTRGPDVSPGGCSPTVASPHHTHPYRHAPSELENRDLPTDPTCHQAFGIPQVHSCKGPGHPTPSPKPPGPK